MTTSRAIFSITGVSSFVIYALTLAPSITWRNNGVDSGDLATAVAVGGVPHPPGYPTYLVLGEFFKLLPLGDVAYRLNLLSAASAALTSAIMALVIYQTLAALAGGQKLDPTASWLSAVCAISASLTLAFSGLFWSQAVIAEVYALNALFAAGLLYGALQIKPSNQNWLIPVLFGLVGLSLGNHLSILLIVPLIIWLLKIEWRWRLVVTTCLAFGLGLSIYLIIPIRAAALPPVNWGGATNWPNFWWLVSAEAYHSLLLALSWQFVPTRLAVLMGLLAGVFIWWGLPVSLLGFQRLLRLNHSLGFASLLTLVLFSIYAIGYNTTDSYIYLLPALLMLSLWLGWGLFDVGHTLRQFLGDKPYADTLIAGGLICLPLLSLWLNFSAQNMSRDGEAYAYAQQSLQIVAADAVIITDDDPRTFALWYGRYGLNLRPDVAIINSNLLPYAWYRQTLRRTHANLLFSDQTNQPLTTLADFVALNLPQAPIYLATLEAPVLVGYRLEPLDSLQRVLEVAHD
jgi:hypothetical protein